MAEAAAAEAAASAAAAFAYATERIRSSSGKEQRRNLDRRRSQGTATDGGSQAELAHLGSVTQSSMAWRQPPHHPHLRPQPRAFLDEAAYMQQVCHHPDLP